MIHPPSRRAARPSPVLLTELSVALFAALFAAVLLSACTRTTTTTETTTTPGGDVKSEAPLHACEADSDCDSDEYCRYALGECAGTGSCETRPEICTKELRPVCGCDQNTYSNPCGAASAGVSLRSQERCGRAGDG